jgi:hypothetical protein
MVCHVSLNTTGGNGSYLVNYLDGCLAKFPDDPFLLEMRAIGYSAMGEHQKALDLLQQRALKLHPNSIRLLYVRATAHSMGSDGSRTTQRKVANKAWDDFLAVAPVDHPKAPAAYYRKAYCCMAETNKNELVECYEKGLAAERLQLPCFLPYDFPPKYRLEKFVHAAKLMVNKQK